MHIDQLQIELRPRTNAQALDLGFALLRSHAGATFKAFLALWLPLIAIVLALTAWRPEYDWAFMLATWWLKPALERAPLYVLSRQVFGTSVTWQQAVRAWPGQLGGGMLRMLTWGRLLAAGRGLYQPMWQLEMARGEVAGARRRVLARDGTAQSAFWFGIVCFYLERVLQFGVLALISIFVSDPQLSNPFSIFNGARDDGDPMREMLNVAVYGMAVAIMTPVYTACCFTLYLNRRASLEAWDLELQLRQIERPAAPRARGRTVQALGACAVLGAALALSLAPAGEALAGPVPPANLDKCSKPPRFTIKRGPDLGPEQARVRREVDAIFAGDDLRGYECHKSWTWKQDVKKVKDPKVTPLDLGALAEVMKVLFIASLAGLVGWLLYRYRHKFPGFYARSASAGRMATEVGGLDIRAGSLPADITGTVRTLWAAGRQRAALALLYRATLSRMVADNGLLLRQGNTEGDCLRLAAESHQCALLPEGRFDVATAATALWLGGAYGDRWPDAATVVACCVQWDAQFGQAPGSAT